MKYLDFKCFVMVSLVDYCSLKGFSRFVEVSLRYCFIFFGTKPFYFGMLIVCSVMY